MEFQQLLEAINVHNRPLIVGSGPSGITAAAVLTHFGQQPVIIDSHRIWEKDTHVDSELTKLHAKTHMGNHFAYYQSEFSTTTYDKGILARQTFGLGGFCRVWGGTIDFSE